MKASLRDIARGRRLAPDDQAKADLLLLPAIVQEMREELRELAREVAALRKAANKDAAR